CSTIFSSVNSVSSSDTGYGFSRAHKSFMISLALFQDFAPAFFSKVGFVVMPLMRPARSKGSMSDFVAESQKMRAAFAAGCLREFPAMSGLVTGMRFLRAKRAVLLMEGVNIK